MACAYGKDFYPRTDLGELQTPLKERCRVTLPMNVLLQAGQQLHLRLFPWSTEERRNLHFEVGEWQIDGVELK